MVLLILFIIIPIIEIALFIQVGGMLGLFPTLAIVVITAIIGARAVKSQGMGVVQKLQGLQHMSPDVAETLTDAAFLIFAGALLLTPGFFTDFVGFMLLIPNMRRVFARHMRVYLIKKHANKARRQNPHQAQRQPYADVEITIKDYEVHDKKPDVK